MTSALAVVMALACSGPGGGDRSAVESVGGGEAGDSPSEQAKAADDDRAAEDGGSGAGDEEVLPDAATLLAAHVEAAGGDEKIAAFKSIYLEGKIEVLKQNLHGVARQWWAQGKYYGEDEIPGIGKTLAGYDGVTAWSSDPFGGLRTLEGREREIYLRSSSLFLSRDWRAHFERAETVGRAEEDGRSLYLVKLTSKLGQEVTMGFDVETKLLYVTKFKQVGPTGETPVEAISEDYRELEGIQFPYRTRLRVPPLMEIVHTIEKIEVNTEIPDSRFRKPDADVSVPANPLDQLFRSGGSGK